MPSAAKSLSPNPSSENLIDAIGLCRNYHIGTRTIPVLSHIDFPVKTGEFVTVMGPSGSGKSTLLHILGCLDQPSEGMYRFDGLDVLTASDRELSHVRAKYIGFVFQTFNLIPSLSVYENVELPFLYSLNHIDDAHARVVDAIGQVGLEKRTNHRPAELSGGEMQRVAIARALSIAPKLILADEPTGNLDSETGREILELFENLHRQGATIVMVTHDPSVADRAQRCVHIVDGRTQKSLP